jgi:hypothetical protein
LDGLLGQVELTKVFAVRLAGEGMPNDAILRESGLSALALGGQPLRALRRMVLELERKPRQMPEL